MGLNGKIKEGTTYLGIFLASIVVLVFMVNFFDNSNKIGKIKTETILSAKLDNETNGSFILGFGSFKNKEYYVVYKVNEDGGKQLTKYNVEDTTIYDNLSEGEQTYAEVTYNKNGTIIEVKLYLPKETIKENYDLSL